MSNLIGLFPMAAGTLDGAPQTWTANTNDLQTLVVATGYLTDKSDVMKGRDFVNIIVDEDGTPALVRGTVVNSGTAAVPILTLDISENVPGDIDLAQGSIIVGNVSAVGAPLDAKTSGNLLLGNATTLVSVPMIGDTTISPTGTSTLNAGYKRQIHFCTGSFETGQTATIKLYFNSAVTVNKIRAFVTKALAATDSGTITARNAASAAMATGVITLAASSAVGVEGTASPTTNNTIAKDANMELVTAKATAGGEVNVWVEYTITAD